MSAETMDASAREIISVTGCWDLEWIEVCRADVTKVLCRAEGTASRNRPALESAGECRWLWSKINRRAAKPEQDRRGTDPEIVSGKTSVTNSTKGTTVAQLQDMLEKILHELRRLARHRSKSPQRRFVGINSDTPRSTNSSASQSRIVRMATSGSVGASERG